MSGKGKKPARKTNNSLSSDFDVSGSGSRDKDMLDPVNEEDEFLERRATSPNLEPDPPPTGHESRPQTPKWRYDVLLEPLGEPIENIQYDETCFEEFEVAFLACERTSSFMNGSTRRERLLRDRWEYAIELGKIMKKNIRIEDPRTLTRTEERTTFVEELSLLRQLLSNVTKYQDDELCILSTKRETLTKLSQLLHQRREVARDSLILSGAGIPSLPVWGPYGKGNQFWSPNDFEIIGACYRKDVETFIAYLADNHQFDKKDKRSNSKSERRQTNSEKRNRPERPMDLDPRLHNQDFGSISRARRVQNNTHRTNPRDQTFNNHNSSIFGGPTQANASQRMRDLFSQGGRERPPHLFRNHEDQGSRSGHSGTPLREQSEPDPSDSSSSDSEGSSYRPPRVPRRERNPTDRRNAQRNRGISNHQGNVVREVQFENNLKIDIIPEWDGNIDVLGRWISKINFIAERSNTVFEQLGTIVPQRLKGNAENWYYSQNTSTRQRLEENWHTLREGIGSYYMNRAFMDKQKGRANRAVYRENGHSRETPSEYVIRKKELIELVYDYTDREMINEIMSSVPTQWTTILTPHLYSNLEEFQLAIKYYEENLLRLEGFRNSRPELDYNSNQRDSNKSSFQNYRQTKSNLVGWSKTTDKPEFPKDDSNVSTRATPEEKGARPCRHCGSGKHWDNECKHSRRGNRAVRTNLVQTNDEDVNAQHEYDEMYYELTSEDEKEKDFEQTLQSKPVEVQEVELTKGLERNQSEYISKSFITRTDSPMMKSNLEKQESFIRPSLNRKSRRRFAKEIERVSYRVERMNDEDKSSLRLRKIMARPSGCAFLGAKATEVLGRINNRETDPLPIIIDSGSDITLISLKTLESMDKPPKMRAGQRIKLIQVTGNATISGYVNLDLMFETAEGPVIMDVEAYVVKGMTTPVILGNDFSDQYSISILRNEGDTQLQFGDTGRKMKVESTFKLNYQDEDGHAFKIRVRKDLTARTSRAKSHRRAQVKQRETIAKQRDQSVRSVRQVIIPPMKSKEISVYTTYPFKSDTLYIEKSVSTNRNIEDIYGSPDTLTFKDHPTLHISNFSTFPVTISAGQAVGKAQNPDYWLDRQERSTDEERVKQEAYCNLVKILI